MVLSDSRADKPQIHRRERYSPDSFQENLDKDSGFMKLERSLSESVLQSSDLQNRQRIEIRGSLKCDNTECVDHKNIAATDDDDDELLSSSTKLNNDDEKDEIYGTVVDKAEIVDGGNTRYIFEDSHSRVGHEDADSEVFTKYLDKLWICREDDVTKSAEKEKECPKDEIEAFNEEDVWSSTGKHEVDDEGNDEDLAPLPFSGALSLAGGIPYSGPIAYSGPVPSSGFSGSVSRRSDGSSASTRSFAFPVLPFEWNASPVRMPPADRRRRSRWCINCLCCTCPSTHP